MKTKVNTKQLALLGLLSALIIVLSNIVIPINGLTITLNVIPIAIAAIALGPTGATVVGAVFGICSFLQCMSILGTSPMGIFTFEINPLLTFLQRFVPRALDGFCVGWIFKGVSKLTNAKISCFVTGFFAAFLNTIFFMSALVIFFGNNPDFQEKYMGGKSPLLYIIAAISGQALLEMAASTMVAGAVGFALYKAKLISIPENNKKTASAVQ